MVIQGIAFAETARKGHGEKKLNLMAGKLSLQCATAPPPRDTQVHHI